MISYTDLIQSWLEYLNLEELSNLKLDAGKIKSFQLYRFNVQGSPITAREKCIRLILKDNDLLKHLMSLREKKEDARKFYLFFPLIERKIDQESFYYPLFIITFFEKPENLLKVDWNPTTSKETEKTENGEKPDSGVSGKEKEEEKEEREENLRYPEKEINTDEITDFVVCKPVFTNFLGFDEEELEIFSGNKSLFITLKELLNNSVSEDADFTVLFSELEKWLKGRLKEFISKKEKRKLNISSFDFVFLCEDDFEVFPDTGWRIKKQLTILKDFRFDPVNNKTSAAYQFIYGEQESTFEEYNQPGDSVWWGTFHEFPLSYGQAFLLQKYASGEKLVAVQGPPGTGKTTALMALIAHTLAERAINIITGKKDYHTVILVASTANKAVQNAAREFQQNKFLNEFALYRNGGLYFSYIGGQEGKEFSESMKRLDRFINYLEKQDPSTAREQLLKIKNRLLDLYSNLFSKLERVNKIRTEYDSVCAKINEIETKHPGLDVEIEEFDRKISNLKSKIEKEYVYPVPEDVERFKHDLQKFSELIRSFQESKLFRLSQDELNFLASSSLKSETESLKSYLINLSFLEKLINLFTRKDKKKMKSFFEKYRSYLEKLGFDLRHLHVFDFDKKWYLAMLDNLLLECELAQKLLTELPHGVFLAESARAMDFLKTCLVLTENLQNLKNLKNQLNQLTRQREEFESDELFSYARREDGVFELWREKFNSFTRELFSQALEFLHLYVILNKEKNLKFLRLFKRLYSRSERHRAREEILKEGLSEFYRWFSLVYPVCFSSLNSSPFVFDAFITDEESAAYFFGNEFKPIYLLFIDEAAMALPHMAYPAVFWSEKVICVGDPLQLPPVVPLDAHTLEFYHEKYYPKLDEEKFHLRFRFSPAHVSVYHRAARCAFGNPDPDNIGQACFLDVHRRCQKPIAELFCKVAGYKHLKIETRTLEEEHREKIEALGGKHVIFYDVEGIRGPYKNTNYAEILAVKAVCEKLKSVGFELKKDVGIITPYRKQESLLKKELSNFDLDQEKIGTIHKFQGIECNVIIMSSVVFGDDSTDFIARTPNLLNVAISRAKYLFILVGSEKKLTNTAYFSKVIDYVKENGIFIKGLEFDETGDREQKRQELIDSSVKEDVFDVFKHIEYFLSLPDKAKKWVLIVSPWIKHHNLENFSYRVLESLSSKGVEIHIVYGYSEKEELSQEVKNKLESLPGLSLYKMPNTTHAKIILVDGREAVISSFNWLSHSYYLYSSQSPEVKAFIRQEMGILTKYETTIKKISNMFRFIST